MEAIKQFIFYAGIPTIIGAFVYIGKKLQALNSLETTTEKIKHNVKIISDTLIQAKIKFDHTELQSYSPLRLTEKGLARAREVGFDIIVKDNKSDFFEYIKSEGANTKYDLEIAAIKSIIALFNNNYFNSVKNFLYNHPDIDERSLRATLGVYLRDEYLKDYPEIK